MAFFDDSINAILVENLDKSFIQTLVQERPFLDRMTKKGGEGGSAKKVPFNAGAGGGQGADLETALANAEEGLGTNYAWIVSPQKGYGVKVLNNWEVPYTESPESAADAMTQATFQSAELAAQDFARNIYGDGHGTRGTIVSHTNPTGNIFVLTLESASEVAGFNMDNVIVSKATPTASIDSGTAKVIGSSVQGLTIRVDAGSSGWTPTSTHVIGLESEMITGSTISTFPGVFGFVPPVDARDSNFVVGDTFLGVVRDAATPVEAVSGFAFDGRGKALISSVRTLAGYMGQFKHSAPDTLYLNPIMGAKLAEAIQSAVRYDIMAKSDGAAEIFYAGFDFVLPTGKCTALMDPNCPVTEMVLTKADSWNFEYPGKSPFKPSSPTGRLYVEDYNSDRIRLSTICTGFFYTTNPAATGVITVSA